MAVDTRPTIERLQSSSSAAVRVRSSTGLRFSIRHGCLLELTGFDGLAPPAVVTAVGESYRRGDQLGRRRIVDRAELDRDIVSADLLDMDPAEWPSDRLASGPRRLNMLNPS
jgi:hypothetical protein